MARRSTSSGRQRQQPARNPQNTLLSRANTASAIRGPRLARPPSIRQPAAAACYNLVRGVAAVFSQTLSPLAGTSKISLPLWGGSGRGLLPLGSSIVAMYEALHEARLPSVLEACR